MMHKQLHRKVWRKNNALTQVAVRNYERMSTEDYLINIRKSMTNTALQKAKLPALLEASNYLQ
jgi:hypothetical protein